MRIPCAETTSNTNTTTTTDEYCCPCLLNAGGLAHSLILTFLDARELLQLKASCTTFRALLDQDGVWKEIFASYTTTTSLYQSKDNTIIDTPTSSFSITYQQRVQRAYRLQQYSQRMHQALGTPHSGNLTTTTQPRTTRDDRSCFAYDRLPSQLYTRVFYKQTHSQYDFYVRVTIVDNNNNNNESEQLVVWEGFVPQVHQSSYRGISFLFPQTDDDDCAPTRETKVPVAETPTPLRECVEQQQQQIQHDWQLTVVAVKKATNHTSAFLPRLVVATGGCVGRPYRQEEAFQGWCVRLPSPMVRTHGLRNDEDWIEVELLVDEWTTTKGIANNDSSTVRRIPRIRGLVLRHEW